MNVFGILSNLALLEFCTKKIREHYARTRFIRYHKLPIVSCVENIERMLTVSEKWSLIWWWSVTFFFLAWKMENTLNLCSQSHSCNWFSALCIIKWLQFWSFKFCMYACTYAFGSLEIWIFYFKNSLHSSYLSNLLKLKF